MASLSPHEQSVEVLGIRVDAVSMAEAVDRIIGWTQIEPRSEPKVAIGINAHVCNQSTDDVLMSKAINAADLTYADGQSIVWAGRILGSAIPERVATTDLVFPLAYEASRLNLRMFFYGADPGVAERAAQRLREMFPELVIASAHGYVPRGETRQLIDKINEFGTDLLFVGLGDPLQQAWVRRHLESLSASVVLTCGGLFDWTAGDNRRPPKWMVRAGFEWLWRVMLEPRRLTGRYMRGNPLFIGRLIRQLMTQGARLGTARARVRIPRSPQGGTRA